MGLAEEGRGGGGGGLGVGVRGSLGSNFKALGYIAV